MKDLETITLVEDFIEKMGMNAQGDGLPRISGKIFGLLLIETGPFSFQEISERLSVSRGSVSTNTRLLENLGIIDRLAVKGERGDFFQLAHAPFTKLLEGVFKRMEKSISTVQEAQQAIPKSWKKSHERLADLQNFYSEYLHSTELLIQKLT